MIEIIPFQQVLADDVCKLILSIENEEFDLGLTLEDQPDLLDIPESYQKGKGNFWVARHNRRVVGTIALFDLNEGICDLRRMFVLSEYRGKQFCVAKVLLETLIIWAKAQEFEEILLETTDPLKAAHRYLCQTWLY